MEKPLIQLQKLGLSQKEARLYLVALENGPATIAKLAQKSGLKRGTIYEFLTEMLEKGLLEVSISGKRKLYASVQPQKLKKIIDRQKEILDNLIPDLSMLTSTSPAKPKIKFYEGKEGLVAAYYEMLDLPNGSEVLGFGLCNFRRNLQAFFRKCHPHIHQKTSCQKNQTEIDHAD